MDDRLDIIFQTQYDQQDVIEGALPLDRAERRRLAERYALYLHGEITEYLKSIAYKHFTPAEELSPAARMTEVADMFKYLLCIAWTEGIGPVELYQAFMDKTEVVSQRHRQELVSAKVAAFDIDGVLADIRSGGYDNRWEEWQKDDWLASGNIARLPGLYGSVSLCRRLSADKWSIVLVTARKRHKHPNIEAETLYWLNKNGIPYDVILWGYDKVETMSEAGIRPTFFVEDSPKHAWDIASWGVPVFLVESKHSDELRLEHELIYRVFYTDVYSFIMNTIEEGKFSHATGVIG